jgi:hypothetical protein
MLGKTSFHRRKMMILIAAISLKEKRNLEKLFQKIKELETRKTYFEMFTPLPFWFL